MKITDLYIDQDVLDLPATRVICDRLKMPGQVVDSADPVYEKLSRTAAPVDQGKKILFLTRNKGAFLRPCPGTDYYTCCNYTILHFGTFCTMDCSYCILQSYFHPPVRRPAHEGFILTGLEDTVSEYLLPRKNAGCS